MMNKLWVLVFVSASLNLHSGDASICKPYSYFKLDCNTCTCGESGKEYSCTRFICRTKSYEADFTVDRTKDGHVLLIPRPKEEHEIDINDEDYIFVGRSIHSRKTRVSPKFRYIDDKIPSVSSSSDMSDNGTENHVNNHNEERNENRSSDDEELFNGTS